MAMELVYTSAARGLRPGSSGFCTVAMTAAMPAPLVPRLEALGGYRPGPSGNGPVAFCHWRVETASGEVHVLSRVGPAPADHTGRSNKIATYLVLGKGELPDAGPAWLLAHPGLLRDSWAGEPCVVAEPVSVPRGEPAPLRASVAWQRACGDAGWAGVVASSFLRERQRPIHVVIHEGTDALALADDVIRLLPGWARWSLTFSTYFLQAVAGTPCALRFCVEGTPAAEAARNSKSPLVDLTRPVGLAPDSRYVRMARSGVFEPEPSAQHLPAAMPADAGGSAAVVPAAAPHRPAREAVPELPEDEPAEEPGASSRLLVIAVVAGVVTLVLLGALVTISTSGTQPVPAVADQPAPQAEPAPAAERTRPEEPAPHEATGGDAPRAPSTRTAPGRPGAGGAGHSPFGAPPASPASPPVPPPVAPAAAPSVPPPAAARQWSILLLSEQRRPRAQFAIRIGRAPR